MRLQDIKLTPLLDTLRLQKISDEIYFSSAYKDYISNSRLGLLNPHQQGSPEKFFEGFKQGGFNQSFMLGTAVHSICLQPEYFEIADDLGKPTAKLGAIADELYNIFVQRNITIDDLIKASDKIDYYKGKIDKKRFTEVINKCTSYWQARQKHELNLTQDKEILYLDTKSREVALACIDALNNNKQVQALLHPCNKNKEIIEKLFSYLWENQLLPDDININLACIELNITVKDVDLEDIKNGIINLMEKQLNYEKKN